MSYSRFLMKEVGVNNIDISREPYKGIEVNQFAIPYERINKVHKSCLITESSEAALLQLKRYVGDGEKLSEYINEYGFSLLFFVKDSTIIQYLIEQGVSPNHLSNSESSQFCDYATPGTTALHYASYYHWYEAIEALIENGADINLLDKDGVSPLGYAIQDLDYYMDKEVKQEKNKQKVLDKLIPAFKTLSILVDKGASAIYFQTYSNKQIGKLLSKVQDTIQLFYISPLLLIYCLNSL